MSQKPRSIMELKASEYKVISVKEEMRKNLIDKLRHGEVIFPGIIGYEESVIPGVETAILAGHDMIFLGERGQAKTMLIRALITLLDEEIPVIKGCEIDDNPYSPVCRRCRDIVKEFGDKVEISWIKRDGRYGEKLSTPDVSIADLIGEVDPIKVAEGRYLSDELTIHFGLIPRSNRGIFAINELPDLVEKVQVGLLNIMEEKDVQIKGYKLRLPLDILIAATANPEDYTNRGRIITPLKDRFQAQIRTHYPSTRDEEINAEITFQARGSHEINQRSGVSVRTTITNYESIIAAAEKRAIKMEEREVSPRITDFPAIVPSTVGKIELEYLGEDTTEASVVEKLIKRAIKIVFDSYFTSLSSFSELLESFEQGYVEVSDTMSSDEYLVGIKEIKGLKKCIETLGIDQTPGQIASAIEFILEGLHLSNKLNKEKVRGRIIYK